MSSGFEESTTKEVKLTEHSQIIKPLLSFIYTGEYDYDAEGVNVQELGMKSIFGFHIRVAALADRLMLPLLFRLANDAADESIYLELKGYDDVDTILEILHLLFDQDSDLELTAQALQDHQTVALDAAKNEKLFQWMLESRPNDSLLNDVSFLKQVVLCFERAFVRMVT